MSSVEPSDSESQLPPLAPAEDHNGTTDHQKLAGGARKRLAMSRIPSAESLAPKGGGKPATRSRAVADPPLNSGRGKKASTGTADIPNPTKEQQAPKQPVKGQESPVAKATHPMETRRKASGAGGLRPGGGSGQTDTCVANGNPSKT
jgi:hypothetical protein